MQQNQKGTGSLPPIPSIDTAFRRTAATNLLESKYGDRVAHMNNSTGYAALIC
jgi:alanine-alpha-ketoisovalerate/valine-pyruvate aminotransferase